MSLEENRAWMWRTGFTPLILARGGCPVAARHIPVCEWYIFRRLPSEFMYFFIRLLTTNSSAHKKRLLYLCCWTWHFKRPESLNVCIWCHIKYGVFMAPIILYYTVNLSWWKRCLTYIRQLKEFIISPFSSSRPQESLTEADLWGGGGCTEATTPPPRRRCLPPSLPKHPDPSNGHGPS